MDNQYDGTSTILSARDGGLHPPLDVIISWPKPNYVNPAARDWTGPVILLTAIALTIIVFVMRIWARLVVGRNLGLDDLLISLAMIPLIGLTVAAYLANTTYGFQWHVWDQNFQTLVTSRQISMAIEMLYLASTSLIKISILCFYRRMANGSISKIFVYCVWGAIVSVVCYALVLSFVVIFTCTPVEGYWLLFDVQWRATNEVTCRNEGALIVSIVIISTLQDLIICALPIFLVWNLQISKRQKAGLMGIFGLGLLTCVCGIMRTYYAIYVYYFTYDITWVAFYGWIWTALEADLAVICASAPALKIFFKRYFSSNIDQSGLSGYERGRTPQISKASAAKSGGISQVGSGRWDTTPVPLDRIKVSTGMNITIEDREDRSSVASNSSVRCLTALPPLSSAEKLVPSNWKDGCRTLCEALMPDAGASERNKTKLNDPERDAESK